ncbi:MAG: DUF427 domain-containing protein [Planctomycetota bacterium]
MAVAKWNGTVIAESGATVVVEGNHYFPAESLKSEFFRDNPTTSVCGWKGTANYYDVVVDGQVNEGAAWVYREPKPEAASIKGHVAFWKGVAVEGSAGDGPDAAGDGLTGQCEI